ncbi:MBL fold metallo-hydrolase [Clostridium sp.]|uniref:MBL fold metallo-hydrolase n=1 Tax=Clostridium sp. TaxID=1506 RepID=UPI0025912946|nr:MBL fold metallo-hydrolase [Clostridium sp.]MDF2503617.1 beta-lactamase protein [Clostridium sp.]
MKSMNNVSDYEIKKSKFMNWEAVFENPAAIEVETLNTGRIVSKISGVLNLQNINASEMKEGCADIPVLAHVLRYEKYGDYLIDTGFDSSFSNIVGGNFKGILKMFYFKNRYIQEKSSEGIEIQLKERGINLKGVFLTHIHEHAAGVPSLSNEIPYVYGDGEREESFFPLVYSNFFENKTNLQKIDFSSAQDMPILGKCIDIFGDGSFWAVSTPGHTKGHISYIVNGKERKTLITGDACITKKGFEINVETGKFSSDIEEGRRSFLKIREFVKKYPFLNVIFGHETDEFKIKYR